MPDMKPKQPDRILLASGSPRRRTLLEQLGLRFDVLPPQLTEWEAVEAPPVELVRHNATLKASWAAARRPEALILASDTTVALGETVLNKPADMAEAHQMLQRLSGQTHTVYTSVALRNDLNDINVLEHVTSQVTFQTLTTEAIKRYCQLVNPLDKAGAYGIQVGKAMIIAHLEGSETNVMGLPTEFLTRLLKQLGLWRSLTLRTSETQQ